MTPRVWPAVGPPRSTRLPDPRRGAADDLPPSSGTGAPRSRARGGPRRVRRISRAPAPGRCVTRAGRHARWSPHPQPLPAMRRPLGATGNEPPAADDRRPHPGSRRARTRTRPRRRSSSTRPGGPALAAAGRGATRRGRWRRVPGSRACPARSDHRRPTPLAAVHGPPASRASSRAAIRACTVSGTSTPGAVGASVATPSMPLRSSSMCTNSRA